MAVFCRVTLICHRTIHCVSQNHNFSSFRRNKTSDTRWLALPIASDSVMSVLPLQEERLHQLKKCQRLLFSIFLLPCALNPIKTESLFSHAKCPDNPLVKLNQNKKRKPAMSPTSSLSSSKCLPELLHHTQDSAVKLYGRAVGHDSIFICCAHKPLSPEN